MINLKKGSRDDDFDDNLLLVSNEIEKEMVLLPEIKFEKTAELTPEKITPEIVTSCPGIH